MGLVNMEEWTEFADWLKNELKEQGLSSKKLENLYGISHHSVQDYMRQKRSPNLDSFLRIVSALGKKVMIVDR